jgi:N-succinyldiaminopimelate aminotransferase
VISKKLRPFGTTIFAEMTRLAQEHRAINLSQGFPDFEGPPEILEAAVDALRSGENQYARSLGHPRLVKAVAAHQKLYYEVELDPMSQVVVFSGATEGIASSMLGLLDPGDEVLLFEPYYDSYPACAALAGANARYCTLRRPDFRFDLAELESLVSERTRLLVLNSPHNPTGKVFDDAELEAIAGLCRRHDLLVLADEVYEHLTFDGARHRPMATLPGMAERTLTLSSAGKTFSFTGWKVGWGTGPEELVAAAQAAHQFVTYATATPLQVAVAAALRGFDREAEESYRLEYAERRDFFVEALREAGFGVTPPRGTYFVLADFSALDEGDDMAFVRRLTTEHGVAAVPPSVFYSRRPEEGRRMARFAFCKRRKTLEAAAERLRAMAGPGGR